MPTLATFGASSARGFGETVGGRLVANITISSNTTNYTLGTSKVTGYKAGKTDVTLTINSGVTVYSTSTGSYAFTVDNSWTTGDTVTVVNNGTILGKGGAGGNGGSGSGGTGSTGSVGGPALYVQRATSINNASGRVAGGGGGGGGGGAAWTPIGDSNAPGGSGGGGIGNGSPNGTLSSGGSGSGGGSFSFEFKGSTVDGTGGTGGSGGTYGSSGSSGGSGSTGNPGRVNTYGGGSGGAAGAAVAGNSNITWINTGTRNGSIS